MNQRQADITEPNHANFRRCRCRNCARQRIQPFLTRLREKAILAWFAF
jgi:hypothetical protein